MKQDKEAITDILSAIAQAQLALSAAERALQEMALGIDIDLSKYFTDFEYGGGGGSATRYSEEEHMLCIKGAKKNEVL